MNANLECERRRHTARHSVKATGHDQTSGLELGGEGDTFDCGLVKSTDGSAE